MSGVDLAQWLSAQLDADAAEIADPYDDKAWHARGCDSVPDVLYPGRETGACDCGVPARVLREIEAKREVVRQYARAFENRRAHPSDLASAGALLSLHGVVKALAKSYSHRPGFAEAVASAT